MTLRRSDTLVIQTFRNHDIHAWIARCLESVQRWAKLQGLDYLLSGDEFFELCGQDYLARGNKNPRAITNLARLVATRQHLDAGYHRVIWMDADVFVFDPKNMIFDFPAQALTTGYAFGREVRIYEDAAGAICATHPMPHNAATYFTQSAVDLDMLITLIRHIDAKRQIVSNFQVGVGLLRGLQGQLMFPTFPHVALLSPITIRALAKRDEKILRFYGEAYRYPACAANLCLALEVNEGLLRQAMDHLEKGGGDIINTYATETGMDLIPFDSETSVKDKRAAFTRWRYRVKAALRAGFG